MNRTTKFLLSVAWVAGCLVCGTAGAHGHGYGGPRVGFDFVVGPWWWDAPGYYYPYYPPVVMAAPAQVYVPPSTAQMPAPAYFWYFCPQSNAYYPYVSGCPGGWQAVSPTPPEPSPAPAR